ncbi:ABC transporter substrate-binding protein [Aquisalimonas asiatica]|uniref:Spermidine/putrescine transport system substrate-binding protein n=1 Tax=Aquisalimonas asiatica TaxID=406100 RepID=A0A1H8RII0_9GAMM|nr:spermidine/putrescine ABC transporter substrate-binding protein [Aquisalimonas asiatica]SEO65968.1 spermidine/putrescine transport system substrate-binding protein [Aquisalimonas asiatica]
MSRILDKNGRPISRRRFLQGMGALAGSTVLASSPFRTLGASDQVLNILTWPGHGDPFVVREFEEQYNCTVRAREYEGGEEMLAMVNQAPPGTYDVIMADAEYIQMLRDGDFIQRLDPSDYPLEDFWPEFQEFESHWADGDLYSVMLRFGYIGMAYRTDIFDEDEVTSYSALWSDKAAGRVGFFDWYLPSMGCVSLYEGNEDPFDIDSAAFEALKERLFSLEPQTAGFRGMSGVFSMLTDGTASVVPGVGDWVAFLLQEDGIPVASAVPEEGGLQWTESLSIANGAQNPDLARAFIQYMTSPEGQVKTARLPAYAASIPNRKGWELLNEDYPDAAKSLRHTFDDRNVIDEYRDGLISLRRLPAQQNIELWNDAWTEFKSL